MIVEGLSWTYMLIVDVAAFFVMGGSGTLHMFGVFAAYDLIFRYPGCGQYDKRVGH